MLGSHTGVLITLGDATLATVVAGVAILGLLPIMLAGLPWSAVDELMFAWPGLACWS